MYYDIREDVVNIILQYPQYKLVGAYSIVKNVSVDDLWEPRETTDIDIRICCELEKEKSPTHLVKVLEEAGFRVEVQTTKADNYRLIVFKENLWVKVDIEYKPGAEIAGAIRSIKESLIEKINLTMIHSDRGFKNFVDVILCLHFQYPAGVTKGELMETIDVDNLHHIDLDVLLKLARKFKPQELNGFPMEEYATAYFSLLNGLLSDSITDDCVFKDFQWYYKK